VRKRLFWQIYLGFVLMALLCVVAAGLVSGLRSDDGAPPPAVRGVAELIVKGLASDDPALGERLARRSRRLNFDLGLWDADGTPLAATSAGLEGPKEADFTEGVRWRIHGGSVLVRLEDGRWLAARSAQAHPRLGRLLLILAAVFFVMALGAYPVARRITRRLEALRGRVEAWGAGDLSVRAEVRGTDEVANLAEHFNRAADRVEALVAGQRRVLANASHELRSPLARLRMGVELLAEAPTEEKRAKRREAAEEDIAELDALIGDVLLASRLEARASERGTAAVPFDAVVSGEAARAGVTAEVEPVTVAGDEALLTRLVRNLVENAVRHGGGGEGVEVRLVREADGARLTVADRGPGVAPEYREAIFEPFFRPPGHREGADGGVGLGLALVRDIARLHGGAARCCEREGGGSLFEVTLSPG